MPEWAAKYRGKVKLVYIDPPFNTEQVFEHYADQREHSIWLTMMRWAGSAVAEVGVSDVIELAPC